MDLAWWKTHGEEARRVFAGEKASMARWPRVTELRHLPSFSNSGAAAMSLAAARGAKRIVMLGYDCQKTGGRVHWHGDHPKTLGNAGSMPKWPAFFRKLAEHLGRHGVVVVNASRETALDMFPRVTLEEALAT